MAYLLAAIAGILNMLQSGTNATLNDRLEAGPVVPALVVYLVGILGVLAAAPFIGKPAEGMLRNAATVPWWGWIGGMLGAFYVVVTLIQAKSMGAGPFTAVTLTAAVVTSLVLDHFGLLGFEVHPASALRLLGGALMVAGVVLVARF
ncbi:DMT family transporter [Pararoseomonas indoligenes]|uniref:DMT family transporter n=1 Tax=Roseomonas indoligenes TaxID=2820811 RepID=A0A940N379_9PROT|nr:DMT family transporter [Pararoseomonas indoligenes]MBP0495196.1 DMT family transporter [Pararoseomonas indoligenes]